MSLREFHAVKFSKAEKSIDVRENDKYVHEKDIHLAYVWRQRGRVVRVPDFESRGRGFESRSDHLAGVVSW